MRERKRVVKAATLTQRHLNPIAESSEPFPFLPLIDDGLILVEIDNLEHHD